MPEAVAESVDWALPVARPVGEPRGEELWEGLAVLLGVDPGELDWEASGVAEGQPLLLRVGRMLLLALGEAVEEADTRATEGLTLGVEEKESLDCVGRRLLVRREVAVVLVLGVEEGDMEGVGESLPPPPARAGLGLLAREPLPLLLRVELLLTLPWALLEALALAAPVLVTVGVKLMRAAELDTVEVGEAE